MCMRCAAIPEICVGLKTSKRAPGGPVCSGTCRESPSACSPWEQPESFPFGWCIAVLPAAIQFGSRQNSLIQPQLSPETRGHLTWSSPACASEAMRTPGFTQGQGRSKHPCAVPKTPYKDSCPKPCSSPVSLQYTNCFSS